MVHAMLREASGRREGDAIWHLRRAGSTLSRAHEGLARVDARLRVGAGGVGSGAQGLLREPAQGEARRRE